MTDDAKKPVTQTAMRDVKAELDAVKHLLEERTKRDDRQSAEINALKKKSGMDAAIDFTTNYPKASCAIGLALLVGGLALASGVKLWICVGGCIFFVPGLNRKAITGLREWRNGNGTAGTKSGGNFGGSV